MRQTKVAAGILGLVGSALGSANEAQEAPGSSERASRRIELRSPKLPVGGLGALASHGID